MKIIWLGQAGLLIHAGGKCIMIDPYLSDSVGRRIRKCGGGYRWIPLS